MSNTSDLNQQKAFLAALQALVKAAIRNHNVVTSKQLEKAFEGMNLDDSRKQMIADYLTQNNIGIDDPAPDADNLTDEEKDYLAAYTESVNALEQPSEGELEAIKINAMAGDKDAQEALITCMLPKVIDIAKLYEGQGVYMEDLIGAGNEALVRGVRVLAPLEGPEEVEGRLGELIMNAMEDLVAENLDEKAIGADAVQMVNHVREKADDLAGMVGHKVTVDELAAEGEVTKDEIMEAIRLTANKIDSIDYKDD